MMKMRYIMDDAANVIIVATVLLLGLLVAVTAIINATYIPEWKSVAEAEQMEEVCEDFKDLKMGIDIVTSAFPDRVVASSHIIGMGGGGTLRTDPDLPSVYIATDDYTQTMAFEHLGSISFESDNHHELDRTYIYESGAVIVEEINRSMMRLAPTIDFTRFNNGTKAVTMRIINMSLDEEVITGDKIANLELVLISEDLVFSDNVLNMSFTITSRHSDAWEEFLIERATCAGFNESEFDITASQNVELDIYGDVLLNVVEVDGDARIRPVIEAIEPT
ncbi:MAG: hypothetical protein SCAL_001696 [Candidatus Syntrophoarchaeum caldarius]|uniref:Uncharacterized protein n=1 Tax=Candidatus Syntropharchaeum caldarium TaxID=1838285 RepID=A0A1F2P833_9EURY|nr:MAG: hypothetical protein SCAL_001696 [Candidatus Syntrophoarchaeum caldarius]